MNDLTQNKEEMENGKPSQVTTANKQRKQCDYIE